MPRGRGGNQSAALVRVLSLIRFLAQRGDIGASVDDIRTHISAFAAFSQDQIARDIRDLGAAGWRVVNAAPPGAQAFYRLYPRDHRIATALTSEERRALRTLASELALPTMPFTGSTSPSDGWATNARTAFNVELRVSHDSAAERAMEILLEACRRRCEVMFKHLGRARRLHPYALRYGEGCWWVDGRDVDADQSESFIVARVERPVLGPPNRFPDPGWTRASTPDPLTWRRETPTWFVLEVEAAQAPDARAAFAPILEAEDPDEARGCVRLTVEVAHKAPFRATLYQFGGAVRIVGPSEAIAAERTWLREQARSAS